LLSTYEFNEKQVAIVCLSRSGKAAKNTAGAAQGVGGHSLRSNFCSKQRKLRVILTHQHKACQEAAKYLSKDITWYLDKSELALLYQEVSMYKTLPRHSERQIWAFYFGPRKSVFQSVKLAGVQVSFQRTLAKPQNRALLQD
jgi:hypothetical protein